MRSSHVDVTASSLPNGTVVFADGQFWNAQAGHEKTGQRWQQANGRGSASDRYMDNLFADRWEGGLAAGPSRVVTYGPSDHAASELMPVNAGSYSEKVVEV